MKHYFPTTDEAYDCCNMGETFEEVDVTKGDTIIIESERVVGVAWAWPVAVTKEFGQLHTVKEGMSYIEFILLEHGAPTLEAFDQAVAVAVELGYELNR